MKTKTTREQIYDFVYRNFIGPENVEVNEKGQEVVHDYPTSRYISGILFPHNVASEVSASPDEENTDRDFQKEDSDSPDYSVESDDEWLNFSNRILPSAISLSVVLTDGQMVKVSVQCAIYRKKEGTTDKDFIFERIEVPNFSVEIDPAKIREKMVDSYPLDGLGKGLVLKAYFRGATSNPHYGLFTFSLINENVLTSEEEKKRRPDYQKCFFQCSFSLSSSSGFQAIPSKKYIGTDEDQANNQLLYRDVKTFAYGHGCSPIWKEEKGGVVREITTSFMPSYVVSSTTHAESAEIGCQLNMLMMSKEEDDASSFADLDMLCSRYEGWIGDLKKKIQSLDVAYQSAASTNVAACERCLSRIKSGLALLKTDEKVRRSFHLMNEAMMLQQIHYNMPKRCYDKEGNIEPYIEPSLEDPTTWPKGKRFGFWRPFQIAFILMNLSSISDPHSPERKIVDLIWFPTGGGKTEAYLGLSAFAIFFERLSDKKGKDHSISVLMRYTLRLLTSQQYQRATSLICACEYIRRKDAAGELGDAPINIGLFVGRDTSPNTMKSAAESFQSLLDSSSNEKTDPFVIRKCPWCGAQIGFDKSHPEGGRHHGYRVSHEVRSKPLFYYRCDDPDCCFNDDHGLPLTVIDEAIFDNPPTLLIGTVDKFATIVFNHEAQHLFGYYDGVKKDNPSLIIQDELHLISGPLGSMVAIYETMLDELLKSEDGTMPKIIASTATISRAKEQCHNLFNVPKENVAAFPPSGIDAGDSFFAHTGNAESGRQYVGVFAPGSPSTSTTSIWLYAALFQMPLHVTFANEKEKDAYWTNIGYYNSLRELGKAATWIRSDIDERSDVLAKRYPTEEVRKASGIVYNELTSRKSGGEIPDSLQLLENSRDGAIKPVDICLATNMISVGLDVQRLGLMTVIGQPKTSSEYIQATSRVGRDASRPGIIFTLYSPMKPRDKSVFESFEAFHSKYYSYVEPTSISVFSPQIRRQALAAILFGTTFLLSSDSSCQDVTEMLTSSAYARAKGAILQRVHALDPEEEEDTKKQLADIDHVVDKLQFFKYCYSLGQWEHYLSQTERPLIYPKGAIVPASWVGSSFTVATSMRDVDATCNLAIWGEM